MAECDCLQGCPFFNDRMAMRPGMAAVYKQRYCLGEYATCARHQVKQGLGKAAVPADLFPNMEERARVILSGR